MPTQIVASAAHSRGMTNATRHQTAVQTIPDLVADIRACAPDPTVQWQLTELLEEKIAFMHLRCGRLPDGRKLVAAIEYEVIAQSLLSAGPPGPSLPFSPALELGDLARAGWLWKARDSARVANNLGDNIPDTRDWMMFLLNPHLARCQYAAWVLVYLRKQRPNDSLADDIASRLVALLNDLLLADFGELQQFLSGMRVQIAEQDVSRYRISAELLLSKRNLLLAADAHPFLHHQLGKRDFWRRLPLDAKDLLTPAAAEPWPNIISEIECGGRPEDMLASGLDVSVDVIRCLSSATSALLTPHILNQTIPLLRHLDPNVLPRSDGDFLKIMLLSGASGAGEQCGLFSAMCERIRHADDVMAAKKWLKSYSRFTKSFTSFNCLATSLLEGFRFDTPPGSPSRTMSLFSFLGEPSFNELDAMLHAWMYIDKHIHEWISEQYGVNTRRRSLDDLDYRKLPDDLVDMIALPGYTAGPALWLFSLAHLIACLPGIGYEQSSARAFSPGPGRGLATPQLRKVLDVLAARP